MKFLMGITIVIQWGDKNLVGSLLRGIFLSGENEQVFVYWGDSPHPPSRENPAWVDLTQYMGEHVRCSQEKAKYLVNTCIIWCQLKNIILLLSQRPSLG